MKLRDQRGNLPVDYACKHSLEMVKLVSQPCSAEDLMPTKLNDITAWHSREVTTLNIACSYGSLEIVEYLINQKRL